MSAADLFDIAGKRAVVTGGASGIGTMIADGFLEAGAEVIIASRKEDSLKAAVAELSSKGPVSYIVADLSNEAGCKALADGVAEQWDSLDILVNNAGATWGVPLDQHDEASWARVIEARATPRAH